MSSFIKTSLIHLLACGCLYASEPLSVPLHSATMGAGSVCILPPRQVTPISWATNVTLKAGQVLLASNGNTYLVVRVESGVTTNSPTHTSGVTKVDGIYYNPLIAQKNARTGLSVSNISTSLLYAAFGQAAVAEKGIYLAPNGGTLLIPFGAPQQGLFVISPTTNSTVTAQDWP